MCTHVCMVVPGSHITAQLQLLRNHISKTACLEKLWECLCSAEQAVFDWATKASKRGVYLFRLTIKPWGSRGITVEETNTSIWSPVIKMPTPRSSSSTQQTIWESFLAKRRRSSRKSIYQLLLRILPSCAIYIFITVFPLTQDDRTTELIPYFLGFQVAETMLLVLATVIAGWKYFQDTYTLGVSVLFSALFLLNFCRGILVDVLVRQNNYYSGDVTDSTPATVIASRVGGTHEFLAGIAMLNTASCLILDLKYLYGFFLGLPLTLILCAMLQIAVDGQISFRSVPTEHVLIPLLIMVLSILVNFFRAKLRTDNEWISYVTRKRLQLECIRTEELLKLCMPKRIAHQQMSGQLKPATYECASVGFIYIANYDDFVRCASKRLTVIVRTNSPFKYIAIRF